MLNVVKLSVVAPLQHLALARVINYDNRVMLQIVASLSWSSLGNCDKFHFTFVIIHQNQVWIVQMIELDQIPIRHLSN